MWWIFFMCHGASLAWKKNICRTAGDKCTEVHKSITFTQWISSWLEAMNPIRITLSYVLYPKASGRFYLWTSLWWLVLLVQSTWRAPSSMSSSHVVQIDNIYYLGLLVCDVGVYIGVWVMQLWISHTTIITTAQLPQSLCDRAELYVFEFVFVIYIVPIKRSMCMASDPIILALPF